MVASRILTGTTNGAVILAHDLHAPMTLAAAQATFQQRTGEYEAGRPWYEERIRLFHDWFLFDHGVGFCNWYASSEVLLLRSLGVPARVAAGFAQGTVDDSGRVYSVLQRDAHHIDDLARVHLAQRAGGDSEILAEGGDLHAIDETGPGNDAVGRQFFGLHTEMRPAVADIGAALLKGIDIEQQGQAFAGAEQAFPVARFQLVGTAAGTHLLAARAQGLDRFRGNRHGFTSENKSGARQYAGKVVEKSPRETRIKRAQCFCF